MLVLFQVFYFISSFNPPWKLYYLIDEEVEGQKVE